MEAMPQPVRSRLEDVVGLTLKPYKEFCDYMIHTVMIGDPREIEVSAGQQVLLGEGIGQISELRVEMEKIIPSEVS